VGKAKTSSKKITTPTVLSFKDADKHLDGALSANFQGGYGTVAVFPGDVSIQGDFEAGIATLIKGEYELIAIEGNLKVDGRIQLYEGLPGLYVGGSTTAETLEGGDCEIYIQDAKLTYFVYGYYNDGTLETGDLKTPWVINSDHDLRVTSDKARTIDNYGDDDDYDFGSETIAVSFVAGVRDGDEIEINKFYKQLKAGKPVLVAGAKTNKERALAEISAAKTGKQQELIIKTTKLKAFPADALKMKQLTKLVLDHNEIGKVPDAIGTLTELEELSLASCDLKTLPATIGKLTKLRVLNIGGNKDDSAKTARPIKLPASLGSLVALEEIDVSGLSDQTGEREGRLADMTPFELPASAANWKKLRVVRASGTNLVIPKAMWGLPSVEVIEMQGSSWSYLKEFPAWITSFPNLKRLDLGGNFFPTIPDLGKLKQLEELDLGNALGFVKKLPNLSKLPKLKKLNVSGNTSHTGVAEPRHAVLQPLFAMKLPALEELRIDRWGGGAKGSNSRGDLKPEMIAGIGGFKALTKLDLEFNGLTKLPADFYQLSALTELKLGYNRLGEAEIKKIQKTWPKAAIDVGSQK